MSRKGYDLTDYVAFYTSLERIISQICDDEALSTDQLRDSASWIVMSFKSSSLNMFEFRADAALSLQLDGLMRTMLERANDCGGSAGERYVASAVVACSKDSSDSTPMDMADRESTFERLRGLGLTWLTHLVFPCILHSSVLALSISHSMISMCFSFRSHGWHRVGQLCPQPSIPSLQRGG